MEKKILISIKAKQVIEYSQEVEVSKEHYKKLKDCDLWDISEDDDKDLFYLLQGYINHSDVFYGEPEYTDVQITKVKTQ